MSRRASAISAAGTVLSQPTRQTSASKSCAWVISSIESAITSRETSDARMPGVPCDWLSETAIVLNGSGTPPASATPAQTWRDSSSWLRLQGIVPVHVEQTPTIGPSSRVGSIPSARKCARAPARSGAAASPARARRRSASWSTQARIRGPMSVVRLGLLSTAGINGAILDARADDAPFRIVAVGSRDAARAQAYAHANGIGRAHAAYEELLADPDVDAVYIALPNSLHHAWTMRALAAGKHVLCEKPYTRHPDEVDEARDEAERHGLVVTEGYMWRHARQTALLRELLPGWASCGRSTRRLRVARACRRRALGARARRRCAARPRLLLHRRGAARHGRAGSRARRGAAARRGGRAFAGTLHFDDVTATFQCSLLAPLVNTIDVIGARRRPAVPSAFVNPPGVVLLTAKSIASRRATTTATSSTTSAPRSAASAPC